MNGAEAKHSPFASNIDDLGIIPKARGRITLVLYTRRIESQLNDGCIQYKKIVTAKRDRFFVMVDSGCWSRARRIADDGGGRKNLRIIMKDTKFDSADRTFKALFLV